MGFFSGERRSLRRMKEAVEDVREVGASGGPVPASSEGRILGKKGMKGGSWGGWGVGVGADSAVAGEEEEP